MDKLKALIAFREYLLPFAQFNDEEWALFCTYLKFCKFKKKEHFITQGDVCKHIAFITTGSVRYYHIINGEDTTGYFSFENEFASSYKSFLTGQPATNNIQAIEDSEMILISKAQLDLMLANSILSYKMERFGRLLAEHYLICYEDRVSSFITQSPEERYLKLLETGREILQRMPQHYVANFLGITPVSLSRIRKRIFA